MSNRFMSNKLPLSIDPVIVSQHDRLILSPDTFMTDVSVKFELVFRFSISFETLLFAVKRLLLNFALRNWSHAAISWLVSDERWNASHTALCHAEGAQFTDFQHFNDFDTKLMKQRLPWTVTRWRCYSTAEPLFESCNMTQAHNTQRTTPNKAGRYTEMLRNEMSKLNFRFLKPSKKIDFFEKGSPPKWPLCCF